MTVEHSFATSGCSANTDREIYRERPGDYYADSIHVTESGGIGINCGGSVIVKPLREWFKAVAQYTTTEPPSPKETQSTPSETREPDAVVISEGMDHRAMIDRNTSCPVGTKLYKAPPSATRPTLRLDQSIGNPGTLPREAYASPSDKHGEISQHDARIYYEFWSKYALGSKTAPSCLLCGAPVAKEQWAITHAELPDIFICACCVEKVRNPIDTAASATVAPEAVTLLERIRESGWYRVSSYDSLKADIDAFIERHSYVHGERKA